MKKSLLLILIALSQITIAQEKENNYMFSLETIGGFTTNSNNLYGYNYGAIFCYNINKSSFYTSLNSMYSYKSSTFDRGVEYKNIELFRSISLGYNYAIISNKKSILYTGMGVKYSKWNERYNDQYFEWKENRFAAEFNLKAVNYFTSTFGVSLAYNITLYDFSSIYNSANLGLVIRI